MKKSMMEARLKFARKEFQKRRKKPIAKHGNETMAKLPAGPSEQRDDAMADAEISRKR